MVLQGKLSAIFLIWFVLRVEHLLGSEFRPMNDKHESHESNQRTLRVLAIHNPPFAILKGNQSGLDIMIAQTMADRMKMNLQVTEVAINNSQLTTENIE